MHKYYLLYNMQQLLTIHVSTRVLCEEYILSKESKNSLSHLCLFAISSFGYVTIEFSCA